MEFVAKLEAFLLALFSKMKMMKIGTASKGEGFAISKLIVAIIGLAIAIMIFFNLVPGITMAIGNASLTGASLALAGLVVVVFIAGIILVIVKYLIGK